VAVTAEHLYPSPLRYPGGKRKLANFVKLLYLENDLVGSEYIEPFAGGASVALALLFEEYASHIHINDLNRSVFTFWRILLDRPEELCERVERARLNMSEWARQRAIQDDPDADELDVAFSTFYLNRTSRSGIIGGGPIGGYKQSGGWKVDARFKKTDLIRRLKRVARFRTRITVTGQDAACYLRTELPKLGNRPVFVYLDPPYYVKGVKRSGLYQNSYEHGDHVKIARLVRRLKAPWIVSYDAAPAIEDLYGRYASLSYSLHYSAHIAHYGSERMFLSPRLRLPSIASPAYVSTSLLDDLRLAG
jgi:DNA adenine methylase